jgi:hypothetical protein
MSATTPRRPTLEGAVLAPFRLLARSRGWRRRLLVLAGLVGSLALVLGLRWLTCLRGLPDVGDPFDVAGFRHEQSIPDSENAFVVYRRARFDPPLAPGSLNIGRVTRVAGKAWSQVDDVARRWVDDSRPDLLIWKQGTTLPRAQAVPPGGLRMSDRAPHEARIGLLCAVTLAGLEGSRLEEAGDLAGAWEWYNAGLRASRHVGMGGARSAERHMGFWARHIVTQQVNRWLTRPGLDAPLLRRALADVVASRAMTAPTSEAIRADYLATLHELDDPPVYRHPREFPENLKAGLARELEGVRRLWLREPERSRRVLRIIYAHCLDGADLPAARRPPRIDSTADPYHFPDGFPYLAPAGARDRSHPLATKALLAWALSSLYASEIYVYAANDPADFDGDRRELAKLAMAVAERLYVAEHGHAPLRNADLVAAGYLDALPEGYDDPAPEEP